MKQILKLHFYDRKINKRLPGIITEEQITFSKECGMETKVKEKKEDEKFPNVRGECYRSVGIKS